MKSHKVLYRWIQSTVLSGLLVMTSVVQADQLEIAYLDDAGQVQTLMINADSSESELELAANLILQGARVTVTKDGKNDLPKLAETVADKTPDSPTSVAVRNTILGVGATLGGNGVNPTLGGGSVDVFQATQPAPPSVPPVPTPVEVDTTDTNVETDEPVTPVSVSILASPN